MPTKTPGVAMHAQVRNSKVAFLILQSHDVSVSRARPLSREAVTQFLRAATSCERYRLCQARVDLNETLFRGHTLCPEARVPIQLTTPRYGRKVVAVAVWVPTFSPRLSKATPPLGE